MLFCIKRTSAKGIFQASFSLLILLCCACTYHKSIKFAPDKDNSILWGARWPAWEDFSGNPTWTASHAEPHAVALTGCLIDYYRLVKRDSVYIHVKTYFVKDSSWVLKGHASPSVLHHEIGHFAISEIIARRVRSYLAQWRGIGINDFDQYAELGRYSAWKTDLNQEYDYYVNHSGVREAQLFWDRRIDSLLNAYSAFSDTLFVLPLWGKDR